jgi:hypothetical protein
LIKHNRWAATVAPQPLRRLITPIGFGDKSLKINLTVFDQTFSQKVCGQAFSQKSFDQTFLKSLRSNIFLKKFVSKHFLKSL